MIKKLNKINGLDLIRVQSIVWATLVIGKFDNIDKIKKMKKKEYDELLDKVDKITKKANWFYEHDYYGVPMPDSIDNIFYDAEPIDTEEVLFVIVCLFREGWLKKTLP